MDETNEKSYLGDITIPKDNQVFYFYKYTSSPLKVKIKTISKDSSRYSKKKPDKIKITTYVKRNDTVFENKKIKHKKEFTPSKTETYRFKKLAVEIRDGNFADIKAYVETEDGNLHIFENQIGVSLLRFSTYGKNNYLFYKHTITHSYNNSEGKYSENKMKDLYVKLSDVMVYDYKIGHRYVPHNLIIELPTNEVQNNTTSATYKIQVETNLDKVVELRAYTDFLSLFGDTENALMQIEGRAYFFVAPFPVALFGNANLMEVEFIKKLSPYVNYSRFEDEAKYFEMPLFPSTLNKNNALGLLEKRYLTMGLEGNLVQLSSKDFPLNLILFGNLSYQLTETLVENEVYHLKAAAYGPGIKLVFKRFNNFGFTYSSSFMWYDYGNFNDGLLGGIAEYPKFRVYSNEVEVYYHPSNNSNQAVFARLRTFNNSELNADEAFYQFQFGYKFAIGNRTIKK